MMGFMIALILGISLCLTQALPTDYSHSKSTILLPYELSELMKPSNNLSTLESRGNVGFRIIDGKTYRTWPRIEVDGNTKAVIDYCYADDDSKMKLEDLFDNGFEEWLQVYDSDGIVFKRVRDDAGNAHHCYDQGSWFYRHVPAGALALQYKAGVAGNYLPGQGYISENEDPNAARHTLLFDPNMYLRGDDPSDEWEQFDYGGMMHELGHVLGLQHEHQRWDAGNFVAINCDHLADSERAKDWIDDNPNAGFTFEEACSDLPRLCWSGRTKIPNGDEASEGDDFKLEGDFDRESIMMYGSGAFADFENDEYAILWKDGSKIKAPEAVSAGDGETLRALYPPSTPSKSKD